MKLSTAVKYGLGAALLSSQDGFKGVDAFTLGSLQCAGDINSNAGGSRKLEEGASGVVGKVVIGRLDNTTTEHFVVMNATNFPKGSLNGTLKVAIPDSKDCTTEAHGRALEFPLNDPVSYVVNELGKIGGKDGWFKQSISEIQGANSTLPVSLADITSGVETEYDLAAYLLSSDNELLGCAHLKKVDDDEDTAAAYYELFIGLNEEEAVKEDTASSGSKKSGVFVFASAIAAVRIAVALGEMLAL